MEKKVGVLIGVVLGALLIVAGVVKPAPLWNLDFVRGMRTSVGEVVTMIFCIGAGVALIGTSLLGLKGKPAK